MIDLKVNLEEQPWDIYTLNNIIEDIKALNDQTGSLGNSIETYKEVTVTLSTAQLTTGLVSGIDLISNLVINGEYWYPYGMTFKMIKDIAVGTASNINFRIGSDVVASVSRNCLSSNNALFNNLEGYFNFSETASTVGVNLYERSSNKFQAVGGNFTGVGNITIELKIRLKKWK